jgi:predicted phosphodiesterase
MPHPAPPEKRRSILRLYVGTAAWTRLNQPAHQSMRILHTSDFHGSLPWFRWLRATARHYDLVCITGDLLAMCDDDGEQAQTHTELISATLRNFPTPLAISSGNHDVISGDVTISPQWLHRLRGPQVWADGDRFVLHGRQFRCIAWGSPLQPAAPGEIWLAHAPPDGCLPGNLLHGGDGGDHEFGELCRAGRGPWLALCGHVHAPVLWCGMAGNTRVFNPGRSNVAPFPDHIRIDLDRGLAEHRCWLDASRSERLLHPSAESSLAGLGEGTWRQRPSRILRPVPRT